ncbi:unnamed protein product [Phaedon cochleariae]|uniref:E3 ubiquitin-protein ligase sinah n=1 Tax=Phaedon cochleariae TaxID=80249 RepID=A0A9P0GP07_PHACE|nr:unnamed protein product [Phaedon cochleariae]
MSDIDVEEHSSPHLRLIEIERKGSQCGFNLTRGRWDPYPWVSRVAEGTAAAAAGLAVGDCVIEVNGKDVVGRRISEIAEMARSGAEPDHVSLLLWNAGVDVHCTPESLCCGPLPQNLQRLSACMSTILAFLECPVCLDTITPPTYQCDNGHLICIRCRSKSERCPVCRLRLQRGRSLISDQIYNAVVDAFDLKDDSEELRATKIQHVFKNRNKKQSIPDIKVTQSYTNKLIAKITGKSSSVDNLSSNNMKLLTPNNVPDENGFTNGQLRSKSLSTNEIFFNESPIVSRSGSMNRLNRKELNALNVNKDYVLKPASYHGSLDSLDVSTNQDCSTSIDEAELYHCPFSSDCSHLIKGSDIFEHFKIIHNHSGPLIQYFTSDISINLKELDGIRDTCYVISSNKDIFFFKISKHIIEDQNTVWSDILLWVWYLGDKKSSREYELQAEIKNSLDKDLLFSVRSSVFSLATSSLRDIEESKRGIFLSSKTLEALGHPLKQLLLNIKIIKISI